MRRLKSIFIITIMAALILQACNLPEGVDPNAPDFNLTITANAALIETALASGELPPADLAQPNTVEPAPAGNEAPPPTEELVNPAANPATPTVTSTNGVTVVVSVDTNCRTGPGQAYPSIYGLPVGVIGKVVGKNSSVPNYWVIEVPNSNGGTCWLWGQYATVTGDTNTLKVVAVPATPTLTKTNTPKPTASPTQTSTPLATKPNAPVITSSSVVCTDQNDGTYKYEVSLQWTDNSNNETGFEIALNPTVNGGQTASYGLGPNVTFFVHQATLPAGTQFTSSVFAQNNAGNSSSSSATVVCP